MGFAFSFGLFPKGCLLALLSLYGPTVKGALVAAANDTGRRSLGRLLPLTATLAATKKSTIGVGRNVPGCA